MLLTTILAGAVLVSAPSLPPPTGDGARAGARLTLPDLPGDFPSLPPAIERSPATSRSPLQRRDQKPQGLPTASPGTFRQVGETAESAWCLPAAQLRTAPSSPRAPPSAPDSAGLAPVPPR